MATSRFNRRVLAASIAALLAPLTTFAATLYWDGGTVDILTPGDGLSQGGTGTWNTVLQNWDQTPTGSAHLAWPNTTADEAVFGGVGGTVSLGVPITANRLTFDVGGYTIDNGGTAANTLTLGGVTPTITVTNAPDSATISAIIAGSADLTKAGSGTLVLSGTNTYTGSTTISAGTLSIGADLNLGAAPGAATPGSLTLSGGGTLATTASFTLNANRGIALGTGGGTINVGTGFTTVYGGVIAGGNSLTKTGSGTLTLSGVNTFTGGLAINAGLVSVTAVGNLGAGAISLNGGTLRTTETAQITFGAANIITVGASGGTLDNAAAFKLLINTVGGLTGSGTLTRTASASNVLVGTSNVLQISVANTGFTGAVILNGGQNEIATNGLGTGLTAGNTITVNSGAELTASAGTISNPLTLNTGANIGGDGGTSTFAGAITVNGNFNVRLGDFFQATNRNLIISGGLTGTGAITLLAANTATVPTAGAGQTLFLNGDNTGYTSNINFVAGFNVAFGAANSFGTGTVTINSTATALGGIGFGYDFGATVPTFTNNRTGTTTGGVFGINTALAATTTLNLATLGGGGMFLGSQSAGTYAATTLTPDGTTYRLGGGLGTLTFSATNVLTGATSLIAGDTRANGTGTVVLGAANDYTGATTINGGTTLQINNGGALGATSTGTTVNAGGSLALSGGITVNEPLTITGTSSTASITNLVNGLVNVSGTNTYAGQINATTGASNARVNVAAGILNLSSNIILSGGGTATGLVFAGTGTINQTGVISGNGSVIATSTGTINPSALNTYTGATTFQNGSGTYNVQSFNSVNGGTPLLASSSLGAPTTVAAGTLQFGASTTAGGVTYLGTGETTDRVINLAGTTGNATISQSGTGLLKFTSNLTATGGGVKTLVLQGSTAGAGEIAGVIPNSSTGNTNLTKSGTGTWTLSGANTYAGTTTINGGNLIISTLSAVGPTPAASSLGSPTTVATGTIGMGSTTTSATLTYVGTGSTSDRVINLAGTTGGAVIDMSGTGTFQVGAVTATGAGIKTLTLTGSTAGVGVIGGAIADNTGTNKTSVTKTGTGTWRLDGTNTYTGATTINAGLLRINGSTASGSAVAVNASAYLGGSGTVGGAVTVAANGGIDLRDGTIGTLTLGSTLALNGTATTQNSLAFDLGSSTVDNIAATGAVTASTANGALITFNQLAGTPLANGTYTLISSAATSVPTGFALATTQSGGHTYALTTATTGNILQVTVGTATTGPAATVWGGTASTAWTAAGNWYTDATSNIATGASPGVGTNVSFNTTTPVAGNLSNTLGGDFEINSLTFLSTATTPVTIGGTTNALTIDAGTANGNAAGNGISQLAAATHTISSRVGLGAAQTWTVAAGGGLTISGLVFDVGTGFTLTKAGAGTLTLSGTANTFTGDIAVTAGILAFAGNSGTNGDPLSLGAGTKTITITNNATIRPTSNANPTGTNTKRFVVGTGGATFDAPTGVTFTLDDATQFSGTGDLTVTGAGSGVVYLNNQAFNFSGNVFVNSGTLRLGTNSVLGTAPGRTITVNSGATLDSNNTSTNIPLGITLNGGTLSAATANGAFTSAIALTANSTVSAGTNFTEAVSGNITGAFSITKTGAGITVLSGTNNYGSGVGASTVVSAGVLQATRTVSLPNYLTTGQVTVASGGTLALNVGGAGEFVATDVTTLLNNGTFASGSGIGFDTTNAGGSFTAPALTTTPSVAAFNLTKLGVGTLVLPNATAFGTGSTTIYNGSVSVTSGANNSLGTGALILGTNAGAPGNLDLGTTSQTVSTVTVRSNSATANTIAIGAGQTLTVTGAVTIGVDTGASPTTNLTVTGATGTFSIGTAATPTNANVQLGNNATTNFSNGATVDLSGVGTFYANLGTGTFRVGDASNAGGTGTLGSTLILAPTTTIRATTITSDSPDGSVTQSIKLGSISNILNANTIEIGGSSGGRSTGLLNFNTTTGTLTVRNLAGSGRAAMNVAYGATATGFVFSSTVDLTGHSADLLLSTLNIAGRTGSTGGATTASFSFDSGTLDATGVTVGNRGGTATTATGVVTGTLTLAGGTVTIGASGLTIATNTSTVSPGSNNVVGTVTISGAAVTVAGAITLGNATTAAELATANLNITGGSLTMGGNIVKGATTGTVTSSLTLNGAGAVLDLGGKNIGALGAGVINNLTFAAGTLQNVNQINGTGGVTKSGPGTLTLAGTNGYSGGTDVATGTVLVTGSIIGNVSVSANATFGGTGTVLTGATGSVSVAADGVIAPGTNGIGTLTVDAAGTVSPAISLTSGADFTFELNTGLASDRLAIINASAGSVAFTGNTINFSDLSLGALSEGNYTLFTANIAGAYSGLTTDGNGFITSGLAIGSGLGAYGGSSLQVLNNNIVLVVVPEPASAAVLLVGLGSLLGLGRFRRRA